MAITDVVLITEQGIDVLMAGEYVPAKSLSAQMRQAVAKDPSIAESYFGALRASHSYLSALFRVPSPSVEDDDANAETRARLLDAETQALYRRRLLFTEGFQQDLHGLNLATTLLEDELHSRISLASLNDAPVPKSAPLYLIVAPNPADIASTQPLDVFTLLRPKDSGRLECARASVYGSLHSRIEAMDGAALYAVHGFPKVLRSDACLMRSALLSQYAGVKREMSVKKMDFYPWLSHETSAN